MICVNTAHVICMYIVLMNISTKTLTHILIAIIFLVTKKLLVITWAGTQLGYHNLAPIETESVLVILHKYQGEILLVT